MGIVTFNNLPRRIKGSPGESIYEDIYVVNRGTVPTYHVRLKALCDIPGAEVTVYPDSVYKLDASKYEEFQVRIRFPEKVSTGNHTLTLKLDNMEHLPDEGTVTVRVAASPLNICVINQILKSRKD